MMVLTFEDKYIIGEASDGQCVKSRIWENVQGQFTGPQSNPSHIRSPCRRPKAMAHSIHQMKEAHCPALLYYLPISSAKLTLFFKRVIEVTGESLISWPKSRCIRELLPQRSFLFIK